MLPDIGNENVSLGGLQTLVTRLCLGKTVTVE